MKKIIAFALLALIVSLFSGCVQPKTNNLPDEEPTAAKRMISDIEAAWRDREQEKYTEPSLESSDISKVETKAPTEPPTEAPTEPPTQKPTEKPKVTLYEDNNVKIYFESIEAGSYFSSDEIDVKFLVQNKLNEKLIFQADTVTIDGISYNNVIMSDPVAPDSMGVITVGVDGAEYVIPEEIGAELKYFTDWGSPTDLRVDVSIPRTQIN
ncbi:MAG: hypothetical protein U0M23_06710 [Acutalibacteraceae bacterium]|nr:hypothetical protein [Acutalibacteraceae bacterium]